MKNLPAGAEFFNAEARTYRQTDMTRAIVVFSSFANSPKKERGQCLTGTHRKVRPLFSDHLQLRVPFLTGVMSARTNPLLNEMQFQLPNNLDQHTFVKNELFLPQYQQDQTENLPSAGIGLYIRFQYCATENREADFSKTSSHFSTRKRYEHV